MPISSPAPVSGAVAEDLLPFSRHQPHTGTCSAGYMLLGLTQEQSNHMGRWGKGSIHHRELPLKGETSANASAVRPHIPSPP